MSEGDHQRRAARGRKAEQEYGELGAAFDAVETSIMGAIRAAKVGQDSLILKLHISLQNLDAVRAALQATIKGGREAAAILEHIEEAGPDDADD